MDLNNPQWLMAFVAVFTVIVNVAGYVLQSKRDKTDFVSKYMPLLEHRIETMEDDKTKYEASREKMQATDDKRQDLLDKTLYELRAIKADRANLLVQQLTWQKRVDFLEEEDEANKKEIKFCKERIAELEKELAKFKLDVKNGNGI
jgi:chromosome segregation ATPase